MLYAKSVVVIDIKDLVLSKSFSSQNDIRIVDSIQLINPKQKEGDQSQTVKSELTNQQCHQFSCIEVAGDKQQSILLFTAISSKGYSFESKK